MQNQCISSATRQWRTLTEKDVNTLFREIKKCEEKGITTDIVLSTDEVLEIREADLENFIMNNVHLLGSNLAFKGRQRDTRAGRLDLLFEDENNDLVVVECMHVSSLLRWLYLATLHLVSLGLFL